MNDVFSIECTNFPFALDADKIIFVEREYEWYINQYIGRNCRRFRKAFAHFHYDFCYLPVCYDEVVVHIVRQLVMASHDINHALVKFAYMDGEKAVFYCVELDNDEKEESLAKQFYHFACWCKVEAERRVKWDEWEKAVGEQMREEELEDCWHRNVKSPRVQIVNDIDNLEMLEEFFEASDEEATEVSYADLQLRNLKNLISELREMGVSEDKIRMAYEKEDKPARLEVTKDNRLLLPEIGKEILLQPVLKALFLLFLRHPNGINFKKMCDHKSELAELYRVVSGRIDQHVIDNTVEKLCDPLDNSIHEKCANIRRKIIDQLGDRLAANYFISGKKGENKRIALPQELIVWE